MLLQNESSEMVMEPAAESPYYVDASTQSLSEDEIRYRNPMVSSPCSGHFYSNFILKL